MKRIIKASGSLILFSFAALIMQAQDSSFSSDKGKLSITFPGEHTESVSDLTTSKTILVEFTYEGYAYFASYSIHAVDIGDPQEMAELSLDAFLESVNGNVVSRVA